MPLEDASLALLARAQRMLRAMLAIADGLNRARTQDEVLRAALDGAFLIPEVAAGWIALNEPVGCVVVASRGLPPALERPGAFVGDCECRRRLLAAEKGPGVSQICCERLVGRSLEETRGLRGHASIALWVGGRVLGLLNLASQQEGLFREEDLEVLRGIGNQIGVALERAMLNERQAAEARIHSEKYRVLVERSHDGICILDREGAVLEANWKACEILGRDRTETMGRRFEEIGGVVDPAAWRAFLQMTFAKGESRFPDFCIVRQDGSNSWVELSSSLVDGGGQPLALVIARDLTGHRRAQDALRLANERLTAIVEAAPVAIVVLDLEGLVRVWNAGAERLFGWTRDEALGMNHPIVVAETREEFQRNCAQLREGEMIENLALRRDRKDGAKIDVRLWAAPIRDSAGRITCFVGILADMGLPAADTSARRGSRVVRPARQAREPRGTRR